MVNVAGAIHRVVNSPEVETLRSVPMIRSSHAAASRCIRGPIRIITQQITQTEVAGYSRLLSDVAQGVTCDLDPRIEISVDVVGAAYRPPGHRVPRALDYPLYLRRFAPAVKHRQPPHVVVRLRWLKPAAKFRHAQVPIDDSAELRPLLGGELPEAGEGQ